MGKKILLGIFIIVLDISGGPPTTYQKISRGDTVPLSKKYEKFEIGLKVILFGNFKH